MNRRTHLMTDDSNIVTATDGQYPAARLPTLYFIGVTTGQSSIMTVFPEWARPLGLTDTVICGMDFAPHAPPEAYREAVQHIKTDELARGALVTTHKVDLVAACRDLFDGLDPYAEMMGEVSCISKRDGKLIGHAKDPITSGLALEAFLPANYWVDTGAGVAVLGAGGSSIAIISYLTEPGRGHNYPERLLVTYRSEPRLDATARVYDPTDMGPICDYYHCPRPEDNDLAVGRLNPYSLVINATGLGKDAPGSPLSDRAKFPMGGIAWDFNYRGDLRFLEQARAQKKRRRLRIEDGWTYFIHGWTHVIAEVFHLEIPPTGPLIDELSEIAARFR